jgi:hypothetical protein
MHTISQNTYNTYNHMQARLYTYILQGDNGGAPCAEGGLFSLANCKPSIRRCARKGDIIVGISGTKMKLGKKKRIIFIAVVTDIVSMREYAINYSLRMDSIYSPELDLLPNPFHNCGHRETDLSGKNVLLSDDFVYFGKKHIAVPDNLNSIIPGRGHQYKPNEPHKETLNDLFNKAKIKNGCGKIGEYNNKKKRGC